jgi:uncharacterized protein YybS (DUF2232 family)
MALELRKSWTMKAVVGNPEVLYLALLSCALTLLPAFVPIGGGLLTILAPFPLIVLAVKYPWPYAMSLMGLEGGLMLLEGQWQPLLFLGQCGLVVLATAGAIRRGWSISQALVGSLVVSFGVGALLLAVYSTFVQSPIQPLVTRYFDNVVYVSQEYVRAVEQFQEDEDEQLTALVEALPQLVFTVLPALMVIGHLCTNLCNYILVRRYCQRSQPPLTLDPDDLTCWRASDYLVWVFLASGVALLVPIDLVSIIGLNVLLVTLAVYLLQGLAIVLFWGQRLPLPLGVQCLIIAMVFLITGPLCVIVCTAAGLFDLWVDFRRQRHHPLLP